MSEPPRQVGIFGGTFDPVHYAHLLLAETCLEECGLDEVRFLPAKTPPHKRGNVITPVRMRLEMLALAVAGIPEYVIDRTDIDREGPAFTVDTLTAIRKQHPDWQLHLLVGGDSVRDFLTWKDPDKIAELAMIVAVNRGDQRLTLDHLPVALRERFTIVQMPAFDLSATELRRRVREGRSLRFRTTAAVQEYIRQHRLYLDGA